MSWVRLFCTWFFFRSVRPTSSSSSPLHGCREKPLSILMCMLPCHGSLPPFPPPARRRRCSWRRSTATSSKFVQSPATAPASWLQASAIETPGWDVWSRTRTPGPAAPFPTLHLPPIATTCSGDGTRSLTWPRPGGTAAAGRRCTWHTLESRRPGWRWDQSRSSRARCRCCHKRFGSEPAVPGRGCPCGGCRPGSRSEGPHLHETSPPPDLDVRRENKHRDVYTGAGQIWAEVMQRPSADNRRKKGKA